MPDSYFNVQTDKQRDTASTFEQRNNEYKDAHTLLYAKVNTLSQNWTGNGNESFKESVESYRKSFEALQEYLKAHTTRLQEVADIYDATDRKWAAKAQDL